jgi:mannose-6-phosphate isomerase-like protein (cupin superfamily)
VAISRSSVESLKNNRGGKMHILLSPKSVGTTSGFLGTLALAPDEVFVKHYHPYSDEYVYIVKGEVTFEDDDTAVIAPAETGVFVSRLAPHRLRNTGTTEAILVFFCSPLAPSPEQGHVLLEEPE